MVVTLPKTNFMVVADDDRLPLHVEDSGTVECVSQLPYLSSLAAESI